MNNHRTLRFFNTTGPCDPDKHYNAPASGHAGEFHPCIPTEPYVKVSLHTALHVKITRN